jgi:hypothetical protein
MKLYDNIKAIKSNPIRWILATAFLITLPILFIIWCVFIITDVVIDRIPDLADRVAELYKGINNA